MAVKGEFRGLLQYTVSTTFKSSFDEGRNAVKLSKRQGFRKFCKVAYISESKGRDIFWCCRVPCERRRLELPRGVWGHAPPPGIFFKRTFRNAVSSVSGTQESVSQEGVEFIQIPFKNVSKKTYIIKNKTNPRNIGNKVTDTEMTECQ